MPARTIVYSGLGPTMEAFDLDPESGALTLIQWLSFPQVIQSAWPNRARTILYIATSDAGPMARVKGPNHFIQALSIARDGTLAPLGPPVRLGNRPLPTTTTWAPSPEAGVGAGIVERLSYDP